ncbi:hypothetical protein [Acidocella facilis]|uniref:hypothetical protein n=1 Tax=Acidocella facilis TaxID=525 RepID=UPI001F2C15AB|nr:hypothetical protein [Acidocella facilis]
MQLEELEAEIKNLRVQLERESALSKARTRALVMCLSALTAVYAGNETGLPHTHPNFWEGFMQEKKNIHDFILSTMQVILNPSDATREAAEEKDIVKKFLEFLVSGAEPERQRPVFSIVDGGRFDEKEK